MNEEEKLKNKEVCDKLTELFSRDVRSMTRLGEAFFKKGRKHSGLGKYSDLYGKSYPLAADTETNFRCSLDRFSEDDSNRIFNFLAVRYGFNSDSLRRKRIVWAKGEIEGLLQITGLSYQEFFRDAAAFRSEHDIGVRIIRNIRVYMFAFGGRHVDLCSRILL